MRIRIEVWNDDHTFNSSTSFTISQEELTKAGAEGETPAVQLQDIVEFWLETNQETP